MRAPLGRDSFVITGEMAVAFAEVNSEAFVSWAKLEHCGSQVSKTKRKIFRSIQKLPLGALETRMGALNCGWGK